MRASTRFQTIYNNSPPSGVKRGSQCCYYNLNSSQRCGVCVPDIANSSLPEAPDVSAPLSIKQQKPWKVSCLLWAGPDTGLLLLPFFAEAFCIRWSHGRRGAASSRRTIKYRWLEGGHQDALLRQSLIKPPAFHARIQTKINCRAACSTSRARF